MSCLVDFRVRVLTTQHHNQLFLIHVVLQGAHSSLEVCTQPIKSVSKPEQIRRKQSMVGQTDEESNSTTKLNKRARGEELLSTLAEMKQVQDQQTQLICLLLQNQQQRQLQQQMPFGLSPSAPPSIEEALALLLRAYEAESLPSRPAKIRKTGMSFPASDQLMLAEMGKSLANLVQVNPPTSSPPPVNMVSSTPCPSPPTLSPLGSSCSENVGTNDSFINDSFTDSFTSLGTDLGFEVETLTTDDWALLGGDLFGWVQTR
eukprot:TRINITY_DN201_c0_g1_i3.p1 TRINITY_DN201_c0_g1~~TRINITY_DN201_c0_g1_i3.p1  ORF type:complete len:260 (+),score=44.49 TRINITY_DN201_c0_g1_i3:286-1065(+)